MTRPTEKNPPVPTFHRDGTVSFFNALTGKWVRGTDKEMHAQLRARRAARAEGRKLYKDALEKRQEAIT